MHTKTNLAMDMALAGLACGLCLDRSMVVQVFASDPFPTRHLQLQVCLRTSKLHSITTMYESGEMFIQNWGSALDIHSWGMLLGKWSEDLWTRATAFSLSSELYIANSLFKVPWTGNTSLYSS